ncbi:MAG: hypothetical protein ACE5NA_00055 [Nitrospiraceae bacterium]
MTDALFSFLGGAADQFTRQQELELHQRLEREHRLALLQEEEAISERAEAREESRRRSLEDRNSTFEAASILAQEPKRFRTKNAAELENLKRQLTTSQRGRIEALEVAGDADRRRERRQEVRRGLASLRTEESQLAQPAADRLPGEGRRKFIRRRGLELERIRGEREREETEVDLEETRARTERLRAETESARDDPTARDTARDRFFDNARQVLDVLQSRADGFRETAFDLTLPQDERDRAAQSLRGINQQIGSVQDVALSQFGLELQPSDGAPRPPVGDSGTVSPAALTQGESAIVSSAVARVTPDGRNVDRVRQSLVNVLSASPNLEIALEEFNTQLGRPTPRELILQSEREVSLGDITSNVIESLLEPSEPPSGMRRREGLGGRGFESEAQDVELLPEVSSELEDALGTPLEQAMSVGPLLLPHPR